ncbi:hypothetical protein [Clostridium akagii]|uniref:hypothetical protein n=1 Tax=Clostridium akagii TaxID=91623 RepID=UPI00047CA81D|nr:hypothetical protein [Clostridium akagii]
MKNSLDAYRNKADTKQSILYDSRNNLLQEIDVVDKLLLFTINNINNKLSQNDSNYINSLVLQKNKLETERQNIYIQLFTKEQMQYSIGKDGVINYKYKIAN